MVDEKVSFFVRNFLYHNNHIAQKTCKQFRITKKQAWKVTFFMMKICKVTKSPILLKISNTKSAQMHLNALTCA